MNELATLTDIKQSFGKLKGCILRDDLKEVIGYVESGISLDMRIPVETIEASIFIEVVDEDMFQTEEAHHFLGTILPQLGYMVIHQMSGMSYAHGYRPNTIIEIKRIEKRLV